MTDETPQAFSHPEARAIATASPSLADRISLRDYIVSAEIGAFQQERGQRQRLRFNIVAEQQTRADAGDDVDQILSYDMLVGAIATELAAERLNLLETLAERIAARVLAAPQVGRVFVRIEKLDRVPGALGVEIVRARRVAGPVLGAEPVLPVPTQPVPIQPVVVFFDNAALAAPDLDPRLDALIAGPVPAVLTVGLPETGRPVAGNAAAQIRIDLLAIEQNAWALAARDPRLTVVATRTELDWALAAGQAVVWAPAKMVLDMPDAPMGAAGDGAALALWLAETLSADHLLVHGRVSVPAGSRVPVRFA